MAVRMTVVCICGSDLVLMLRLLLARSHGGRGLFLQRVVVMIPRHILGKIASFKNMHLRAGYAAAIDAFDLQRGPKIQSGGCTLQHLRVDAGIDQCPEEHVPAYACKAIEIRDGHGFDFFRATEFPNVAIAQLDTG
jgi:hypothetical protein